MKKKYILALSLVIIVLIISIVLANGAMENYRTREVKAIQKFVSNNPDLDIEPKKLKVLDVGAGEGHLSNALNYDITMIDIESKNSDVIIYDGENIPFEDNSFDLVLCVYVLHHISEGKRQSFIKELSRVATHVIIFEDLPDTSLSALGRLFYKKHFKIFGTEPREAYSKEALEDALSEHFDIINRKTLSPTFVVQYSRIGLLLRKFNA